MRSRYDRELEKLSNNLLKMGVLCENTITLAIKCFEKDSGISEKMVKLAEVEIDDFEKEIEHQCLTLLLQQQPVARDLRQISATLKIITDLERIGDQALDIADLSKYSDSLPPQIKKMAEEVAKMLSMSIDAFVNKDLELAKDTISSDDIVDSLFLKTRCDIIEILKSEANSPENAVDMLMIAKYLERIADHAVNVSEWVIFSLTGLHKGEHYDSNS